MSTFTKVLVNANQFSIVDGVEQGYLAGLQAGIAMPTDLQSSFEKDEQGYYPSCVINFKWAFVEGGNAQIAEKFASLIVKLRNHPDACKISCKLDYESLVHHENGKVYMNVLDIESDELLPLEAAPVEGLSSAASALLAGAQTNRKVWKSSLPKVSPRQQNLI